jgi:hypothetical protein
MEDSLDGGTEGCSDGIARAAKGSRGSKRSHPHVRQRRFPELLLDPHCLQHIVMASLYVPLCEGCVDVCKQGIAREFEAGY